MSSFNTLSVALANADVVVEDFPAPTAPAPRTCAGTTKAGSPCRNRPVAGSDFCRLHQPAAAPKPAPTATPADALAALQAAIAAAKAEAKARAEAEARAKAEAEARAKARRKACAKAKAEALRRAEARRDADARDEYDRAVAPLAQALAEARRLGDLVPAEAVIAAQAAVDALREEFNAAQAQRAADLRALEAQVRRVEESAAYRAHLDILAALHAKGGQTLARANEALNAKDFDRAERLASKALRAVFPDDIRDRAEMFLDSVRYQRRHATRAARRRGDILVTIGHGQFAHLRPMGKGWKVVSALGYDAPAEYRRVPRGARHLSWKKKKGGA